MLEVLSSFTISVIANIATPWLNSLLQKGLLAKVKAAYIRALKKWASHNIDWESQKYKERLVDLANYMQNQSGVVRLPSDIELLNYYKDELSAEPEVWSIVEESLLTYIASIATDTNKLLTEISSYLNSCKVSQREFEDSVQRLLSLQLARNISSGKYLEDTYLEVDELKEKLRFFVKPNLFFRLTRERASRLNFDDLRWKLSIKDEESFDFNIDDIANDNAYITSFELLYEASRRLSSYLDKKHKELAGGGNTRHFQSRKISRLKDLNDCIYKRVFILTSKAGQGKTNILCDLTKNVLLKREIPAAYLNGYELDADNVEKSFSQRLFSTKNYSLDDILQAARSYCELHQVPFVFVIDGLNENSSPWRLKSSMESFLCTILQYDFVKVIVSCRTEYYNAHFTSIGTIFENDTIIETDINNRIYNHWDKLKELYFKYFSIDCTHISDETANRFCDNFLMFRIFCEVNRGKKPYEISISKDSLFDAYYGIMIKRIAEELQADGHNMAYETMLSEFLREVVESMIAKDAYANMPLAIICNNATEQKQRIINRFLDNNVLVRKDLMPDNKSPFKNSEVINFTFDEFRDYLISHYLVDRVLAKDKEDFRSYVTKFTSSEHLLSEGVRTFLFFYVKRTMNQAALDILKHQDWYIPVFKELIWDLDEKHLDAEDIDLVRDSLKENDITVAKSLVYRHWSTQKHTRLNIRLLLDYLSSLDLNGLRAFFDKAWPDTPEEPYYWILDRHNLSPREELLSQIENCIDTKTKSLAHQEQQNLYELVLYLSAIDYSAHQLYEEYLHCIRDDEQVRHVMESTRCTELQTMTEEWLQ